MTRIYTRTLFYRHIDPAISSNAASGRCSITVTQHLAPNVDTVVACAEGVDAVNRETSLELRIGLLENEVERLRLQLIVLTKALAKVIRILKSR
jgi:hypothetical protein